MFKQLHKRMSLALIVLSYKLLIWFASRNYFLWVLYLAFFDIPLVMVATLILAILAAIREFKCCLVENDVPINLSHSFYEENKERVIRRLKKNMRRYTSSVPSVKVSEK
ncbi:hypothetical protein [Methylomonas sp. 11b]|uniref:hypothetical protein n=1 Tax=Methylomonas sp. 11b TaxID=1168169 RepID=UPI00047C65EC|nr:hypothetical protein [Methylomonas sp. 11b]